MNYHNITTDDMLNGDGLRTVLWIAGCNHHCEGCQNPETWNENGGILFDEDAKQELLDKLKPDHIDGITFSGGDPLFPGNRQTVTDLAKYIKQNMVNKTVWCYTGYTFEQVKDLPIMKYIDVLVDGEFIKSLNDNTLHWKGSSNQRVINVPKTLAQDSIILHEE